LNRLYAYHAAGYDYVCVEGCMLPFPVKERRRLSSHSLNDGVSIRMMRDAENAAWPDISALDWSSLDAVSAELPEGMGIIACPSGGGVLETMIELMGFDGLCVALFEDRPLVRFVAERVGQALLAYYEQVLSHPSVFSIISSDDWGFKTQTMLSPNDLREFVLPWHRRFVQAADKCGKPALLHSCGQIGALMDDVIAMGFAAKHSFEDAILPIERSLEQYGDRIALLGGIDVDFLCRAPKEAIARRCRELLERTQCRGWALGSGNSIPEYVPPENYLAMIEAVATGEGGRGMREL
jgi:uroporphyrinogen decarboxylase